MQIGPALDNAVNDYANTPTCQVGRDARTALGAVGEAVEHNLSYPLRPDQRGQQAGTLMPVFFFEGMSEPLHAETAQQMGLIFMGEADLATLGIRRAVQEGCDLHMPELPGLGQNDLTVLETLRENEAQKALRWGHSPELFKVGTHE